MKDEKKLHHLSVKNGLVLPPYKKIFTVQIFTNLQIFDFLQVIQKNAKRTENL